MLLFYPFRMTCEPRADTDSNCCMRRISEDFIFLFAMYKQVNYVCIRFIIINTVIRDENNHRQLSDVYK